ncbi:11790_t:CDS:1, partial [Ambispora leptoticha]
YFYKSDVIFGTDSKKRREIINIQGINESTVAVCAKGYNHIE